jgi:hypothetical protein
MPADVLPARYGADDPSMPESFEQQLVYPLKMR